MGFGTVMLGVATLGKVGRGKDAMVGHGLVLSG